MTPLITRLEEAAEGSRELDAEISQALMFPTMLRWGDHHWRRGHVGGWTTLPSFTTSIDEAIALAERLHPCWSWSVGQNVHHKYWLAYALALDDDRSSFQPTQGTAKTPALALCAAILRANHKDKP